MKYRENVTDLGVEIHKSTSKNRMGDYMKVVAVVPMKLNNRRLPGKNTRSFTNGNPLCTYILNTLSDVPSIDEVYVYCSDDSIKQYLPPGVRFMSRPNRLNLDSTKINEVLREFARVVDSDIYLLAHATAPFIGRKSIEEGIDAVLNRGYDSSFSVEKMQTFVWLDRNKSNYDLSNIPRTQDMEPIFVETSGFYCFKKETIVDHGRRIGFNPFMVEVGKEESIDIDELIDFEMADAWFNYTLGGGACTRN
ncbi:acylneuraminate cytidylyltransferase family protein [Methanomethylophilus alvi]|uniref:acylneuraminate cytidylyltransferase family protein n=1 Tax=Methanomethylophilus alvi TaxID=1291540 RepID=UPI0037DC0904